MNFDPNETPAETKARTMKKDFTFTEPNTRLVHKYMDMYSRDILGEFMYMGFRVEGFITGISVPRDGTPAIIHVRPTGRVAPQFATYVNVTEADDYLRKTLAEKQLALTQFHNVLDLEDNMKVYEAIVVNLNEQGEPVGILDSGILLVAKSVQDAKNEVLVGYATAHGIKGGALARYQVRVREFQSL